jgi:hypothetical protein
MEGKSSQLYECNTSPASRNSFEGFDCDRHAVLEPVWLANEPSSVNVLKELGLNPMSDPIPRGLAACPRDRR